MRTASHYRAKADGWRAWLDEHPDAKPNHRACAERLIAAYESVIPEAEAVFGRLRALGPTEEATCQGPGCDRTFPHRANRRTCSVACRRALSRQKPRRGPRSHAESRPNRRKVVRGGMPQSVTSEAA